jgi:uncharacterized membrane protein
MASICAQIFDTILLRPYVFAFFAIYFFSCSLHLGLKRAAVFCVAGYLIAWLSELSSIHTGIPYGLYSYTGLTKGSEIWVLGVPFMDSLSYVFLAYASYSMALIVASPLAVCGWVLCVLETRKIRSSQYTRFLGALFFVYIDIIVDPVALRGSRWFLGHLYEYPVKGVYFGVPISNFIGWFVVGYLMIYALQKTDAFFFRRKDLSGHRRPWRHLVGPALYLCVLIFNLSITFSIREYTLGWVGVFIFLLPLVLLFSIIKLKLSLGNTDDAIDDHVSDFPNVIARRIGSNQNPQ